MKDIKVLTIIGNGFDKHHEIKSSYKDYCIWLQKHEKELYEKINSLYNIKDINWWNDFERELGTIDINSIANEAFQTYISENYNKDHVLAAADAENELFYFFFAILATFNCWINELNPPAESKKIQLDENGFFINFNYTRTLQELYGIEDEQIFHIHGTKDSKPTDFILGHNVPYLTAVRRYFPNLGDKTEAEIDEEYWKLGSTESYIKHEFQEDIVNAFESMRKNTEAILFNNRELFQSFKNVRTIYIYGFSFSEIDLPYIDEIVNVIDVRATQWVISCHSKEDKARVSKYMNSKGIPLSQKNTLGIYRVIELDNITIRRNS